MRRRRGDPHFGAGSPEGILWIWGDPGDLGSTWCTKAITYSLRVHSRRWRSSLGGAATHSLFDLSSFIDLLGVSRWGGGELRCVCVFAMVGVEVVFNKRIFLFLNFCEDRGTMLPRKLLQ